ncbi:PepSY-associated TM helix domain-containing protein [Neptunicella sp. SCSIO 80796]|uniref:PepSY-associated TM helix domain-containing protein n=1 Tax=Neptunicella plasticusilytica TaxID=3117012 RepID=UPI003A4D9E80
MIIKLHRWLGWLIGIWFVLVSLSGATLLYKNDLLQWQYPQLPAYQTVENISHWGPLLNQLQQDRRYRSVRLPTQQAPWLEVTSHSGDHYYFNEQRQQVLVRSPHSDWIDWLYDFHLHLLLDDLGHDILGYLGIATLLLIFTGLIRWWPKHWHWRLWRLSWRGNGFRMARQWHSTFASLFAPLLLVSVITGTLIIYSAVTKSSLSWLLNDPVPVKPVKLANPYPVSQTDWSSMLTSAQQHWPQAQLRLFRLRAGNDDPVSFRARDKDEWHPNGRSVIMIDPSNNQILSSKLANQLGSGQQINNGIYPLHVATVGGKLFKMALLVSGVVPAVLLVSGLFYSLYRRRKQATSFNR